MSLALRYFRSLSSTYKPFRPFTQEKTWKLIRPVGFVSLNATTIISASRREKGAEEK